MRRKKGFILWLSAAFIIFLSPNFNYAQETHPAETLIEPEAQWLWGEVVSVDADTRQLAIKYFDYETDAEKDITVNTDEKTTFENVKSIIEIKPFDTLSVDYIVSADGKNIATNISVEKAESGSDIPKEEPTEGKPEPAS